MEFTYADGSTLSSQCRHIKNTAAKVDELLKTPAYAAWWATKLSDFLGNNPRTLRGNGQNNYGERFSRQWYDWMKERIAKNEPYDQMMALYPPRTPGTVNIYTREFFTAVHDRLNEGGLATYWVPVGRPNPGTDVNTTAPVCEW